jgi:hypothetical protein
LLRRPAHARHFAAVWRCIWLPQTETPPHDYLRDELDEWVTVQFQSGASYDRIVRQLLSVAPPASPAGNAERQTTPVTFLLANDMRPEELAANTTRELLGVNLECAECHDHPFAAWKREQFWQTAAFFARGASSQAIPNIAIPDSGQTVAAQVWTGESIAWPDDRDAATPRHVLAQWVTSPRNPLFAQNAVNRLWAYLLGAALCEPVDDLTSAGEGPHAELLAELADQFVSHGFDVDFLTQAILESRVYQLSAGQSRETPESSDFSAAAVRSLSGEQLFDSLQVATGRALVQADLESAERLLGRRRFVDAFRTY